MNMGQNLAIEKRKHQTQQQSIRQTDSPTPVLTPSKLSQGSSTTPNQPQFGNSLFWAIQASAKEDEIKKKNQEIQQKDAIIQQQRAMLGYFGYPYPPVISPPKQQSQAAPRFGDLVTATSGLIRDIQNERELKQQETKIRQEARQEVIQKLQQKGYLSPFVPAKTLLNQITDPVTPFL